MLETLLFTVALLTASAAAPQQPPPPAPPGAPPVTPVALDTETAGLMQAWALMAQGEPGLARSHATTLLQKFPTSLGVIVLAIEASVATGDAADALEQYNRWVGQRSFEEPSLLRRVALAILAHEAGKDGSPASVEALRLLRSQPDADRERLAAARGGSARGELKLRAAGGDDAAIGQLVAEMTDGSTDVVGALETLGATRSERAATAIRQRLADQRPEVRGAAAEALGRMAISGSAKTLLPLLDDESSFVRTKAAAALLRLDDMSGLPLLQALLNSDSPSARLIGAEALAVSPDGAWIEVVRGLASGGEPTIRLGAARLLVPHDPEAARSVAAAVAADPNPAVRELATRVLAESAGRDLTVLRRLLSSEDALTRVRAAGSVAAVTR